MKMKFSTLAIGAMLMTLALSQTKANALPSAMQNGAMSNIPSAGITMVASGQNGASGGNTYYGRYKNNKYRNQNRIGQHGIYAAKQTLCEHYLRKAEQTGRRYWWTKFQHCLETLN